jgi:Uncharacterised nucleotidyltransferase
MAEPVWPLLVRIWRGEQSCAELQPAEWDLLIRQARRARVLGSLADYLQRQDLLTSLPEPIRRHFESALRLTAKQRRDLQWEVACLNTAFRDLPCALVLLKGAAYAIADLAPGRGRWFSDIDILVPFEHLQAVEKQLMLHGWIGEAKSEYDQRYYRRWMHEIEPLKHAMRGSVVDLHHNILPRTVRVCPDAALLLAAVETIPDSDGVCMLSSLDRVIHSAAHLFYDGELEHGFRDLLDLQGLWTELDQQAKQSLPQRAKQLGLQQAVYYALRYCAMILNTPQLQSTMNEMEQQSNVRRAIGLMDFLFCRALLPDHASCDDYYTGLARWLLYVRAHYLRMPLRLLIPHLLRKTWMRWRQPQQN